MGMFSQATLEAYERAQDTVANRNIREGYPGKPDSSQAGGYVYEVPGKPGLIYVREMNADQFVGLAEVFNAGAALNPNLRVRFRPIGGVLTIDMPSPSHALQTFGAYASSTAVPPHVQTVAFGSTDFIDADRFEPGRVTYRKEGGLFLTINPFAHQNGMYPGNVAYDISASVSALSADERCWLLVIVDTTDNTERVVTSTPGQYINDRAVPLETLYALFANTTDREVVLDALVIYYGMTDVTSATRFLSTRWLLNPKHPKNNYTASAAPTANDDSADGYEVGSIWINGANIYDCTDSTVGAASWALRSSSSASGGTISGAAIAQCDGRLTLTSGTAVTTTDVTAATTLYFTAYKGNTITLYDGSSTWTGRTFTEINLDISGLSVGTVYDIFAYWSGSAVVLESTAWTNTTTRATALTTQDGVHVRTGATTRRYLGTIYIETAGQCDDSAARRHVWNNTHPCLRRMLADPSDSTHTYSTNTIREWNNGSTPGDTRVSFVVGLNEHAVHAFMQSVAESSSAGTGLRTNIGLDSSSTGSAIEVNPNTPGTNQRAYAGVTYNAMPGVGAHTLRMLQAANAATTTWHGRYSQMTAEIMA